MDYLKDVYLDADEYDFNLINPICEITLLIISSCSINDIIESQYMEVSMGIINAKPNINIQKYALVCIQFLILVNLSLFNL